MKKDDFGADIISISDEDGNNYELEHVDTIEVDGVYYLAFLPANVDEDSEDYALILLKKDKDDAFTRCLWSASLTMMSLRTKKNKVLKISCGVRDEPV